jgi:hypothetical protein
LHFSGAPEVLTIKAAYGKQKMVALPGNKLAGPKQNFSSSASFINKRLRFIIMVIILMWRSHQ